MYYHRLRLWVAGLALTASLGAQPLTQPPFTPATERLAGMAQRRRLAEESIVNGIRFKSIGPTAMSGRVADLDVWTEDPSHFYVAYASGGVWRTQNNGATFEPLFDQEAVMTIGDIAVDWKRNTVWVGTGEVNSSRSSYSGAGMYKSTDGGQTWAHAGLGESHHIGRIVLHPNNPNVLWVAALGHLYSPNQERGVYKTEDGGQTWRRTLFVNQNAGAVDVVIDPVNPNVLYAATWERERRAWNFVESGAGSGIWKSEDGGETWKRLNERKSGFPNGPGAGRIGLDIVHFKGQTVLYAAIDNNDRRPKEAPEEDKLTKDALRAMSAADFARLPTYQVRAYLQENGFPEKYSVQEIKDQIAGGKITPATLAEYTDDANSLLFDTEVVGLEVYRSEDGGQSWSKTHKGYLDDVYYSYGYYFGQVRVSPADPQRVYVFGVPVLRSDDGGQNWKGINGDNVHGDHHALWINPRRPGHLVLGNDGGINISYDDGKTWIKCNNAPLGQFYAVAVDMADPYRVYGGLQDNGVWMGSHQYDYSNGWHQDGQYPYRELLGGDGMQVAIDPRDNETVYTGFQFGNYFRINTRTNERKYITPSHDLGQPPYRWNWQTPIHLSTHNPDILYMGANKLIRSMNRGDDFAPISGDLTRGGQKGDVPYGTLTSIHESPLRFGLLYTGSDDGLVHLSRDGGYSWTNISAGLPEHYWVSRVQAGAHRESTVYVSLNGYRWDNFSSLLYASDDYGATWRRIGQNLPPEPVNVVREDPRRQGLLYVGTDHGLYVSLDHGATFMAMNNGLPAVAVHDLVVHPRENHLIVGTHGRSLYLADVAPLQALDEQVLAAPLHLIAPGALRSRGNWGSHSWFRNEPAEPRILVSFYAGAPGRATLTLQAKDGPILRRITAEAVKGLNQLSYDGAFDAAQLEAYTAYLNKNLKPDERPRRPKAADNGKLYLQPGKYVMVLEKDGEKREVDWEVK